MSDEQFSALAALIIVLTLVLSGGGAIYGANAKVWCAREGKQAVVGVFDYACVESKP